MRVDEFDFTLPEELIALRPAQPRDSARLLVVGETGALADRLVNELPGLLRAGDLLVFNDTRVIAARLIGRRHRGAGSAQIHVTLHRRLAPDRWAAFARPAKRLAEGDFIRFGGGELSCGLAARVAARGEGGEVELVFERAGIDLDLAIAEFGHAPLPPYIAARRAEDERDDIDYQTVYAREAGSVAAPTAGLHFTTDLLSSLQAAGIGSTFVTLEVGAGTFLPVKAEDTSSHRMHAERGVVGEAAARAISEARAAGGRIVCVGTTSLRLIESASGVDGEVHPFDAETDIFITPGYRFRVADGLMTNFHLPRSTLFMLVSAFCGLTTMRAAYAHAIAAGYRFYSYGDASLLWRQG